MPLWRSFNDTNSVREGIKDKTFCLCKRFAYAWTMKIKHFLNDSNHVQLFEKTKIKQKWIKNVLSSFFEHLNKIGIRIQNMFYFHIFLIWKSILQAKCFISYTLRWRTFRRTFIMAFQRVFLIFTFVAKYWSKPDKIWSNCFSAISAV